MEVGLLEQEDAAGPDRSGEPAEDVDALREVVQEGAGADQVVAVAERVAGDVDAADLEVRQREPVEEAGVDVAGDDAAGGPTLPASQCETLPLPAPTSRQRQPAATPSWSSRKKSCGSSIRDISVRRSSSCGMLCGST